MPGTCCCDPAWSPSLSYFGLLPCPTSRAVPLSLQGTHPGVIKCCLPTPLPGGTGGCSGLGYWTLWRASALFSHSKCQVDTSLFSQCLLMTRLMGIMINNRYNNNKLSPLCLRPKATFSSLDLYPFPFLPAPVKGQIEALRDLRVWNSSVKAGRVEEA